jgi:hypothetical protein
MQDCSKAEALSNFFVWALNSTDAQHIASRQGFVLTSSSPTLMKRFWALQKNFTCDGIAVSSHYDCIQDGTVCSNAGICLSNSCACNTGRIGQYCETVSSQSDSNTTTIAIGTLLNPCTPICVVNALLTDA